VAAPPPAPARSTAPAHVDNARDSKRLLEQARAAMGQGQYPQAEELFKKARASGMYHGQAATGLAELAFQRGRSADALVLARQAVVAGGGVPAKMVLGNAYFKLGRYDEAIAVYQQVLKVSKNHVEAQRNLQLAEKRRGL
jgi:tetratricopeptide (TPR) repeat protein